MHSPSEQNYIPQLQVDCVIFGYQDGQLKVLIPKLDFKGDFWSLPGGFVYQDENLDEAAGRILEARTGIKDVYLDQFRVFGSTTRTSKGFLERLIELNAEKLGDRRFNRKEYDWFTRRFISIGFYALVDISQVRLQKIELDESIGWYSIKELPLMVMDHNEIVESALETLRLFLDQKVLAYHLLPEVFTMKEVQQLYEAIYDRGFAANNFPKKILEQNVLERLEKKFTGAANKAPYLYRLRRSE
ncbi:NUDIX domain-containing protein [Spirosoma sp. HMF4905]|uniref:NUDIX domain-containing protein n=1 Tax=Spirosoma arboris TaxID=2682092 RepID=A0A7K1SIU0_9BACT|nr:NUDIX domain-containing protein [Spirosoma arboris]MVM33739.1 NUDIX domain-containing protein [Spirosoma arboris]